MKYSAWILAKLKEELEKFGHEVCAIRWAPDFDDMRYELESQDCTGESY